MVLDTKPGQATAHETRRPEHSQVMAEGPEPTNPPAALEQLALHPRQKELDGSTCGFIEGRTDSPFRCKVDEHCVVRPRMSYMGCCKNGARNCKAVWTTCYDSTDRDLFDEANGWTRYCGNSKRPYCKTHLYQDDNDDFRGVTLLGCGKAPGQTLEVWYSIPPELALATPSEESPIPSSDTESSTTDQAPSSSTGAIVGGVVGGLAVIGICVVAIMFITRRYKPSRRRRRHRPDGRSFNPEIQNIDARSHVTDTVPPYTP